MKSGQITISVFSVFVNFRKRGWKKCLSPLEATILSSSVVYYNSTRLIFLHVTSCITRVLADRVATYFIPTMSNLLQQRQSSNDGNNWHFGVRTHLIGSLGVRDNF